MFTKYILAACAAVALSGASWGWYQGLRAERAKEALSEARQTILRLNLEADQRREIDDAVSDVDGLGPDDLTLWLRERAGPRAFDD